MNRSFSLPGDTPEEIGVYIHIPFCKKKCSYCDFLSFLLPCQDRVADYVLGLKKELGLWADRLQRPQAISVYIGGGTPSILDLSFLEEISRAVYKYFSPGPECEFTLEANPGTLSRSKLEGISALGINRLSLGVQAMDDNLLREMGRIHNCKDVREAVFLARQAGIGNISVDLMNGLPGQTLEDWKDTLEKTINLQPEHISAYGLTIEANTVWGERHARGELTLPGEDQCVAMYWTSQKVLSLAGYRQYEISNYAKPGYECRHNLGYWYRRPYIGVGLGAATFINEVRYRNHSDLNSYLGAVSAGSIPATEEERLTKDQAMSETMFLNLRTSKGMDIARFEQQFGTDVYSAFNGQAEVLEKAGVLISHEGWLRLDPDYYLLSNEVFRRFLP